MTELAKKESIKTMLRKLTGKKHIYLTDRGNTAIDVVCSRFEKVLIPEEGGWIHYKKVGHGEVKCHEAVIDLDDFREKVESFDMFLYHQPGGYFAEQPIQEIYDICQKVGCVVVMDIAGSIGTDLVEGKCADFIIGSFGKWKLVDAGKGGFIATDTKLDVELGIKELGIKEIGIKEIGIKEIHDEEMLKRIEEKLSHLNERIAYLQSIRQKIVSDLKEFDIIKKDEFGINVIIKYKNEKEKQEIITYCKLHELEYTECPRYIRINEHAISIEVKRK